MRKPGEPIYLRGHMVALAVAVVLPILLVQMYKTYVGKIDFGVQMSVALLISVLVGLALYFAYRSSAGNQP
jgi:L-cystine uptake protein TcyP (sodium:dicarboxylate symporter family)